MVLILVIYPLRDNVDPVRSPEPEPVMSLYAPEPARSLRQSTALLWS